MFYKFQQAYTSVKQWSAFDHDRIANQNIYTSRFQLCLSILQQKRQKKDNEDIGTIWQMAFLIQKDFHNDLIALKPSVFIFMVLLVGCLLIYIFMLKKFSILVLQFVYYELNAIFLIRSLHTCVFISFFSPKD